MKTIVFRNLLMASIAGVSCMALPGCIIAAWAAQAEREGNHVVEPEYDGLQGKSVAVVVKADRRIQSEFPEMVKELTVRINKRLSDSKVPKSYADTTELLSYLYNRPQWTTMPLGELAKDLKVDRLVYIELREFRLHEPGNSWTWDGAASGVVAVIEADSATPDEYAFQKPVSVTFPDSQGQGPAQMTGLVVGSALLSRFSDRAAWPMYTHEEPNTPKY